MIHWQYMLRMAMQKIVIGTVDLLVNVFACQIHFVNFFRSAKKYLGLVL
jgi:hypothetical protein